MGECLLGSFYNITFLNNSLNNAFSSRSYPAVLITMDLFRGGSYE